MSFNVSGLPRLRMPFVLALAGAAVFSQFANASIIDTSVNVTYELTSTFTPVTGNTYDVFLALDATHFSQAPGFLIAVALQFQNNATVSLISAPGGTADWSFVAGGTNSGGCDGNGNFECFKYVGSDNASAVPAASLYDFEFAVTLPGTTALIAANDIKAVYKTNRDGSGQLLGQTSQTASIDSCTGNGCGQINPLGSNTPEPGTMMMMLSGMGLLGVGAFRKFRS